MDVPRETATAVFGTALPLAERYAELLATDGLTRGLLGPREAPRLWSRHLLGSAVLARACPATGVVADIGSGAGLPGIPVALVRPDLTVRLVEPLLRRATFLQEVVATLELPRVEVLRARAEDCRWSADLVLARAVAPLARLVPWCLPLVAPGGSLLAVKGDRAHDELASAEPVLRRSRAVSWEVEELGADVLDAPVRVVRVRVG